MVSNIMPKARVSHRFEEIEQPCFTGMCCPGELNRGMHQALLSELRKAGIQRSVRKTFVESYTFPRRWLFKSGNVNYQVSES